MFTFSETYAPYSGTAVLPALAEGTPLGGRYTPWIGDFNGDGNVDIAAFQEDRSFSPPRRYVQFLLGNGDGTFTPTYDTFYFNSSLPCTAFDLNNDGKADMVELDGYMASFHVIPAQTGPALQLQMVSDPVLGTQGSVQISLATPAAGGTSVTLTTSDPAITIPASVSISPGSLTQDVSFQIGSSFSASHVFWIQASFNGSTTVAYGTQAMPGGQYGVALSSSNIAQSIQAGQTSANYGLNATSVAGYSTSLNMSCQGLPAGASCQFVTNPVMVPEGGEAGLSVSVSTSTSTPLGEYAFTVVGTDGAVTASANETLDVGDYSVGISPASVTALPNTTANYTLNISAVDNYSANLTATCSGVPAPGLCNLGSFVGTFSEPFNIGTNALAAGNYNFTVSVTNGFTTRNASAQLSIQDFNATLSANTETISVGQSANVTVNVVGLNGFADPVTLTCGGVPSGVSCSFTPGVVTPSSTGVPATMAIVVSSQPNAIGAPQRAKPATRRLPQSMGAFEVGFVGIFAVALGTRRRKCFGLLVLVMAACLLGSCGGGNGGGSGGAGGGSGGSGGGGGVGGGGGGGGGGTTSVTFTITVQGSADNVTKNLGMVQITVP
jgi:hypothetical protein